VDANLERPRDVGAHRVSTCSLAFPQQADEAARVAAELVTALTGTTPPTARSRFDLINHLVGLLAGLPKATVTSSAEDCIIAGTLQSKEYTLAWEGIQLR